MSTAEHSNHQCPSCGATFQGKFCHTCGEKVFHPSDLGLKKFTSQTVDIFTHFDTKFIRSLKHLFIHPGFLPHAYTTGQRVKYAKPMQVFLLANIIFYFLTHILGVTDYSPNFGDHHYYDLSDYWILGWLKGFDVYLADLIDQLGIWKMHRLGLTEEQFMETFYENSWIYSKTFIILLIPLYALVLWPLYSKRFKYFGSAVIFAVYFVSFQLIVFSIYSLIRKNLQIDILYPFEWLLLESPLKYVSQVFISNGFEFVNIIFWVPYLYFAIQRIHKSNVPLTFVTSFLCAKIFFYLTFGFYKKILIVLTVLLMHQVH